MTSFVKYISAQKINLIISANITSEKYRKWCRTNLKNFLQIYIRATLNQLKKRDYKKTTIVVKYMIDLFLSTPIELKSIFCFSVLAIIWSLNSHN